MAEARADKLEAEVQQLRQELAAATAAPKQPPAGTAELKKLQAELEHERRRVTEVQEQKDSADAAYKTLLGRVSTIRTTLGERMKADAVCLSTPPPPLGRVIRADRTLQEELAQMKQTVEELAEQNRAYADTVEELRDEVDGLRNEKEETMKELGALRNRLNLAQQNWNKEREDLINAERFTREEFEVTRQAMQDWEVIATEERAVRESLSDRVVELEEQLAAQKDLYDRIAVDYEKNRSSVDGLQRALQEMQDGTYPPLPTPTPLLTHTPPQPAVKSSAKSSKTHKRRSWR